MSENYGLYIHIPFCVRKCPYCDFYSVSDLFMTKKFIKALLTEIKLRSDKNNKFDTIYFGGGTPSLLEPCDIEKILCMIDENFAINSFPEITIEVNPGTVNQTFFSDIKSIGINRINIGVQSFQENKLKFLSRIHSADQAKQAVSLSLESGFNNTGLDLIYALPKENIQTWIADIDEALKFMPSHISCYMLSYEHGTQMYNDLKKGLITPLNDTVTADLFTLTSYYLTENHNFFHYEISNFASDTKTKSIHNQKYWSGAPYLGFGPSAHSFDIKTRSWNIKNVRSYIKQLNLKKIPVMEKEILTKEQKITEMIMLSLRTSAGINFLNFRELTGQEFLYCFGHITKSLEAESMAVTDKNHFHLTLKGMLFLDSIITAFVKNIPAENIQ